MAWFRPMGADEVAYHQATVVGRGRRPSRRGARLLRLPRRDAAAVGRRGRRPPRALAGEVTPRRTRRRSGRAGSVDPPPGRGWWRRGGRGSSWWCRAHKSVAVLGVIGRAEDMHSILDVETAATMDWLDDWFQDRGGRRGRAQTRTADRRADLRRDPPRAPPGPATRHRTTTCWWPTWSRCSTTGAGSRASTARHCATPSRPPRWSAGSTPRHGRSSWASTIEPDDGPVGQPAALAHRRHPRRGVRGVLQAGRRDRRAPRRHRPARLPGPRRSPPARPGP